MPVGIVTAHLRGGFANQHPRHQRHARHVAADPKLVFGQVLVAGADHPLEVVKDDRRQLLHLEALRIAAADFVQVGHNMVEVDFGRIEQYVFGGH